MIFMQGLCPFSGTSSCTGITDAVPLIVYPIHIPYPHDLPIPSLNSRRKVGDGPDMLKRYAINPSVEVLSPMRPADRRMAAPSWWEPTPFLDHFPSETTNRFSTSMLVYPEVMYVYIQLYVYIYTRSIYTNIIQ